MTTVCGKERGMVTVELSIGFVTLCLLCSLLAGVLLAGVAQVGASRAAAEVARQLARGDAGAAARARQEAPPGAVFETAEVSGGVAVSVRAPVRVLGRDLVEVGATAWARREPGAGP